MSLMAREFATMNLVVIGLIVMVGFAFLKVVKKRWED
jgi:LPXTG-motif cell wall-anchored protein